MSGSRPETGNSEKVNEYAETQCSEEPQTGDEEIVVKDPPIRKKRWRPKLSRFKAIGNAYQCCLTIVGGH